MTPHWKQQRERSSAPAIALLAWIALHLGRRTARALLPPLVLYFYLTSPGARRASREFLRRAAAPQQGMRGVLRHMHTFAACGLDRIFLVSGRYRDIRVTVHDPDGILAHYDATGRAIIPTAHLGSFEALRVLGVDRKGLRFRIVMDRGHNNMATQLLERLNPALARDIIDGSAGATLTLALHEALQQGCMIGLMADRVTAIDRGAAVPFLGRPAQLPLGPWRLAAVLGAPVVLCFALYRGNSHYELHFEQFHHGGAPPRAQREAFVADCLRRYAERLEHYARSAPYNWFNFYDFWEHDAAGHH